MEEADKTISNLNQAWNDFNSLKIRLNTDPFLERYELFIRGEKIEYTQTKEGMLIAQKVKVGAPKANEIGIQNILSWMSGIINPQIVQGNFLLDKKGFSNSFESWIYDFQIEFMTYLLTNLYEFDIDEREVEGLVQQAYLTVKPYMTRLIANKEREGFGQSVKSDTSVIRPKKGLNLFKND